MICIAFASSPVGTSAGWDRSESAEVRWYGTLPAGWLNLRRRLARWAQYTIDDSPAGLNTPYTPVTLCGEYWDVGLLRYQEWKYSCLGGAMRCRCSVSWGWFLPVWLRNWLPVGSFKRLHLHIVLICIVYLKCLLKVYCIQTLSCIYCTLNTILSNRYILYILVLHCPMFPTFTFFPTIFPILTRNFFHYTSWSVVLSIKFLKPQRIFAQVQRARASEFVPLSLEGHPLGKHCRRISNKHTWQHTWQRETNKMSRSIKIHQDPSLDEWKASVISLFSLLRSGKIT